MKYVIQLPTGRVMLSNSLTKSFVLGVGSTLNLFPSRKVVIRGSSHDLHALQGDLEKIGADFSSAIDKSQMAGKENK